MNNSKTYLNVSYAQKDEAKNLGAKWDANKKKWYVPANKDIEIFKKWHVSVMSQDSSSSSDKKSTGVITYAKDKNFNAYHNDEPPWV